MASANREKNKGPLWATLYEELRRDILSQKLIEGSKLSEAYVCRKYNVSRTPVREALFQLEAEGLVRIIPNRGAFVSGLSDRDISDIYDLRCLFETQAAEWAIVRMSGEEIDKLHETLDFMELYTLRGDSERISEFNTVFHDIIYEGCGNRFLRNTLLTYRTYIRNALPTMFHSSEQLKDILKEHKAIYLAFETRNTKIGHRMMEDHLQKSKARFMANRLLLDNDEKSY